MQNLAKHMHFKKLIFIKKNLTQNMQHIETIVNVINNKLQKISLQNSFL
jgi:hypothetical protein